MSLADALQAFRDMLQTSTRATVAIARPDDAHEALYVWPWRIEPRPNARTPLPPRAGEIAAPHVPGLQVHVLMFARPALSPAGLDLLARAHRAMAETPVTVTPQGRIQCTLESLAADQLAAILQAAGIELTLCLGAVLRID